MLNVILGKWTRLISVGTLFVWKTKDGDRNVRALRRRREEWLEGFQKRGIIPPGELAITPMLQPESKQPLIFEPNRDETEAIKY